MATHDAQEEVPLVGIAHGMEEEEEDHATSLAKQRSQCIAKLFLANFANQKRVLVCQVADC
jgi:hypothetical protein